MPIKLLRFGTVGITVLSLFFINRPLVTSAQASYICGYSTSGVLQSGMTGYYYPYIVECSTGEKIGWGNLGTWGMGTYVRINEPVIVEITPVQLNDGTIISKEVQSWSNYSEIPDCSACNPSESPAHPPTSQLEQLCGWVDFVPMPPGMQATYDFVMTIWSTEETVHLAQPFYTEYDDPVTQNWADQFWAVLTEPGYYRLYNPVLEGEWVTIFDKIEKVEICEVSTPTPASPALEVSFVQIEPSQVSVFELVRITMIIENRGAPLNQPFWGYRGEVILENENGEVIERHSFAKGDASFISPIAEGGQVNFEKWLLTVKVRFGTAVSNSRVIVILQPKVQPSELRGEGRLDVNPGLSGLTCTSAVINKLVAPFSSDVGKDLLDTITAELQAINCEDGDVTCAAPPLVKGFVKILGRAIFGVIGKIITGIWGVFDTDVLQVCRNPVNWMWQLVKEFNKQGVPISVSGVHSPMTILVTNSSGQRAGFVSDDEIVTEIPDSKVIEWEGDKYVIYPASPDITILLQATGDGTVNISLIDGLAGRELSYGDIAISEGNKAQIDMSNLQNQLVVDTNGDGKPDGIYNPVKTEMLRILEVPPSPPPPTNPPAGIPPAANPPRGICGGSLGLIALPFFMALVLGCFRKPKGNHDAPNCRPTRASSGRSLRSRR